MDYQKGNFLYEGKAKRIFTVQGHEDLLWFEFKDSLTAFNAQKTGSFEKKGATNRKIASIIFRALKEKGIDSHWVEDLTEVDMICKKVEIVPLEVVVRNRLAGSTAKKFGIDEGTHLEKPLVEFYYKNDALADPFLSDDQALMLKAAKNEGELQNLKTLALAVNERLKQIFAAVGIDLIDFKIEFGRRPDGSLLLADEISPDSCRLWDVQTGERLDKDRFRRDLGQVKESYLEIANRLTQKWG